tara:strand:- start:1134 stop:1352 length:219 start_codon:yes stop_codon:yes gene_type:complete
MGMVEYRHNQRKDYIMIYVAKPKIANSVGLKTFKSLSAAIAYLAEWGVETIGSTEAEKAEELGWIGKLKKAA